MLSPLWGLAEAGLLAEERGGRTEGSAMARRTEGSRQGRVTAAGIAAPPGGIRSCPSARLRANRGRFRGRRRPGNESCHGSQHCAAAGNGQ